MVTWIYGQSGAGKTNLAKKMRKTEILLDGDDLRSVWTDLDLTREGRYLQNMRIAKLARLFDLQGFDVIVATICPYRDLRSDIYDITKCKFIYVSGGKETSDEYPFEL